LTTTNQHKAYLQSAITKRYRNQFWVPFITLTSIVLVVILFFYLTKNSRIWYGTELLYPLLFLMKELFPLIITIVWVSGLSVILFGQWRRSASDVVALVDSIDMMQRGRQGDLITTPANLVELQPTMQAMFDSALMNRKAVEEAERRKSDLLLFLAHDLKTPLTSTIGYLNLLQDSRDIEQKKRQAYTKIALEKAMRLEAFVEQFFEIGRLNLQEISLNKVEFSLDVMLAQIAEEFFPLLEDREKTISIYTSGDIQVYGDAELLARVFNNVLHNAIVYSDAHSPIAIEASDQNGATLITISNRGETIPQEQLNTIFEKFFRLEEARGSATGGSGLGLAIAKEIVTQHGGSITAVSNYGQTSFTVCLPRR